MYEDVHSSTVQGGKEEKEKETTQISIHKNKDKFNACACSVIKMKNGTHSVFILHY